MVRPSQPLLLGVREVSRSIDISGMRHRHFAVGAQIDQRRQAQAVPNRIRPLHKALLHVVGLGVHQRHREENGEGEKESAALHGFTHFNSTPCVFSIYRTKSKALFGNFPLGRSLGATQAKLTEEHQQVTHGNQTIAIDVAWATGDAAKVLWIEATFVFHIENRVVIQGL